ncbi:hypothetical protein P280DRAFT_523272 [Massarina eburnea CBS 473.64]|uniref:Zn(2)-C6 fungal-type domain-containing protein n=1 Tax=Massarina eburnea CBS 473.64 TaxID=1395130 RepID=A0A6A6RM75_9PLEO|nr:hypothetical protein P280DRAFT_523272 [Massarina eburnea CBS 473.64]
MTYDEDEQPRRKRARVACTTCNARRVKCNITETRPCDNCVAGGVVCETRESRRGKHPRRPRAQGMPDGVSRHEPLDGRGGADVSSRPRDYDEVAASHVLASLSTLKSNASFDSIPLAQSMTTQSFIPTSLPTASTSFIEPDRPEDDGAVFLGESSSLRFTEQVPELPSRQQRPRFRHSVPNAAKADALIPEWEAERRRGRIRSLHNDGAFSFPPATVREELLKSYFKWFHPHFPVTNEPEIWACHHAGTISPLLLQSMLFIGVIHAEDSTLQDLGWGTRHRAKYQFYTRAKDIYDVEFETRKFIVIQALFLMSFWRAGALLEKDARHWLGAAISLAQTKALHRATESEGNDVVTGLRRRIWWGIYVRERQCSSALGLPNRIRDEDCDVEVLGEESFKGAFDASIPEETVSRYTAYMIGIMRLSICLGQIVDSGYLPNRTLATVDRTRIRLELYKWKSQLPPCIRLSSDTGDHPSFQANMLHLAYNNLLVLLHRPAFLMTLPASPLTTSPPDEEKEPANITLQAASRNSRIVEDMLSDGTICHAQIHVITNLFNTLCIHVAHVRKTGGVNRTIAEHRAKLCLLGLRELQRTWEVTNWVLQLFFQYLDRATADRLSVENAKDDGASAGAADQNFDIGTESDQETDVQLDKAASNNVGNATTTIGGGAGVNVGGEFDSAMTPWSWTTDEANQYLFSQIESDFAFGEGGILQWSPEDLSSTFPGLDFGGLDPLN